MKWSICLVVLGIMSSGCGAGISAPTETISSVSTLSPQESEFLKLLNALRKEQGLTALTLDPTLQATAAHHTSYMASKDMLTHAEPDPNGSSSERIANIGGSYAYTGENVAYGSTDAASLFDQWYGSSGHREIMLSDKFQFIGISGEKGYWTADFAGDHL